MTPAEFYYAMLDTMQDVLLVRGSNVKYEDKAVTVNEEMTATLKATVVKDWLIAIGGLQLFE